MKILKIQTVILIFLLLCVAVIGPLQTVWVVLPVYLLGGLTTFAWMIRRLGPPGEGPFFGWTMAMVLISWPIMAAFGGVLVSFEYIVETEAVVNYIKNIQK